VEVTLKDNDKAFDKVFKMLQQHHQTNYINAEIDAELCIFPS